MYLKSIEISGFKSFGKKSSLDFTSPISAIVGPNGSGKSNVAEAFRFVLGEQSIKSLRGKRAEDLIFNGGKDVQRSNRASVKVIFDNVQRILNVDFDEVSLERVVHRDSSSEYLINGSQVRLRDIIELLSTAHIGASGHHIISQGEADKILNANIRDRREMIEDALGLKIYQYKKEESQRKLEKTEENIKQVESLRREIAPHIRFLKKQMEKIEKAVQMKEELTVMYRDYFRREEEYINFTKDRILKEKGPIMEESKKLEEELKSARATLESSKGKDEKSDEVVSLEQQIKGARADRDTLTRELGRIEGEVSSLRRIIQKQRDLSLLSANKSVDLSVVEGLVVSIEKEIDSLSSVNDLGQIKSSLLNIKKNARNFIVENRGEVKDDSYKELEADIQKLTNQKTDTESKIVQATEKETTLLEQYNFIKSEIEKERDSNRDAEKALFRIVAEQNSLSSKLSDIRNREERLKKDQDELKRELQEASVLVGLGAIRFKDFWPQKDGNIPLTLEEIVSEDRTRQEERRRAMEKIKIRLEDSGVSAGDDIVKEFKDATERDLFLEKELGDLIQSSASLQTLIKELDEKLTNEFKEGVNKINTQFQEFFSSMFGGGSASLSVIKEKKRKRADTDLPIEGDESELAEEEETQEGLDIEVNLPRKKTKGLMMLSGGERALTSIALLFAISQVNPPPFIILDETDAALDEANSKKYGDMIGNLSKYSQLILITHNRETMSRAGVIYGVTMGADGVSRLLSIQFDEAVAVAK